MKVTERDLSKFYGYNSSTLWNWSKRVDEGSEIHKHRREALELYYAITKSGLSIYDVLSSAEKISKLSEQVEYMEAEINAFVDKHEQLRGITRNG